MIRNLCYLLIIFSFFSCSSNDIIPPKAKKGVLDISEWDFNKNGPLELNGEWEFYWKKFITPKTILNKKIKPVYVRLPGVWNNLKINDKKLPPHGYATYQIKIILPEKYVMNNKNIENLILSIKVPPILTSYKIFINDIEYGGMGKPGKNEGNTIPAHLYKIYKFIQKNSELTITLHVSNFHFYFGGINSKIILSTFGSIVRREKSSRNFELFVLGSILIIAFYHIGIYLYRRKEPSALFFSFLCFSADHIPFLQYSWLNFFVKAPFVK